MSNISQNIFAAIDTIADKKLAEAPYDRTFQATIVDVSERSKGRYKVQYQDAIFDAFASGGTKYSMRDSVYVLVPGNKFSNNKFIIGGVNGVGKLPSGGGEGGANIDIDDIFDEIMDRLPVYKGAYTVVERS